MLWGAEFNRDVLLSSDRSSVQKSRLVTPLSNRALCRGNKRSRTAQKSYIHYLAELPDRHADLHSFRRYVSIPQPIAFPTGGGETAHAFYYPPFSPEFAAPPDEKAPVLVKSHAGPTSAASSTFSLSPQEAPPAAETCSRPLNEWPSS